MRFFTLSSSTITIKLLEVKVLVSVVEKDKQAERFSWVLEIDGAADAFNEFGLGRKCQRLVLKIPNPTIGFRVLVPLSLFFSSLKGHFRCMSAIFSELMSL